MNWQLLFFHEKIALLSCTALMIVTIYSEVYTLYPLLKTHELVAVGYNTNAMAAIGQQKR